MKPERVRVLQVHLESHFQKKNLSLEGAGMKLHKKRDSRYVYCTAGSYAQSFLTWNEWSIHESLSTWSRHDGKSVSL